MPDRVNKVSRLPLRIRRHLLARYAQFRCGRAKAALNLPLKDFFSFATRSRCALDGDDRGTSSSLGQGRRKLALSQESGAGGEISKSAHHFRLVTDIWLIEARRD